MSPASEPIPDKSSKRAADGPHLTRAAPEELPVSEGAQDVTSAPYMTDVTTLTERIAMQLAAEGVNHPVAAAVAIALRGSSNLDPALFASEVGLTETELSRIEHGEVPLADLPATLGQLMTKARLEPLALADLARQLRGF